MFVKYNDETFGDWICRISPILDDIYKSKIDIIEPGHGITMIDDRPSGHSRIYIGTNSSNNIGTTTDPKIQTTMDMLVAEVADLKKTNNLLVNFIKEHLRNEK